MLDFVFMAGQRHHDELKADFLRYRSRLRKDALIAWDGLQSVVPVGGLASGGQCLWVEMRALYPHRADYLEGTAMPGGGIAVVRV